VLEDLDQFKGSMAMIAAMGRWSLGAHARKLPDYHQHHQVGSVKGAMTAACQRLTLAAVVIVMWSKDLDIISIIFSVLCTSYKLSGIDSDLSRKKKHQSLFTKQVR
jgi:hypothetical protein